jgi:hypothetical protein
MRVRTARRSPVLRRGDVGIGRPRAVLLAAAASSLLACGLDWTMPEPGSDGGEHSGSHAHASTTAATGSGGSASGSTGAGGAGPAGATVASSSTASSASSSSSSGSGASGALCDDQAGTCNDCEACADPICFGDCYADTGDGGCAALDSCINDYCAEDEECIESECLPYYPRGALQSYNEALDCMYCTQCADACGC